ncbi:MAG: hypothetical protein ABUK01_14115 [Leptospirales bacterium]
MKKNSTFAYYTGMINNNTPYEQLPIQPDNILEVRLKSEIWKRIVRIALHKDKTYSWVVRYCLFRLIKRTDARKNIGYCQRFWEKPKFKKLQALAKEHLGVEEMHRHKLCLYGEDEFFIRMTAGLMYCTMTHLVRLALESNLDKLEMICFGKSGPLPSGVQPLRPRSRLPSAKLVWFPFRTRGNVRLQNQARSHSAFHEAAFYWLGIKLYAGVVLPTEAPKHKDFRLERFNPWDYW